MAKAEKAAEPSMDEILASIRKIIADEPGSARKPGAPQPFPGAAAIGPSPHGELPPAPAPVTRKSALDDVLGMADPVVVPQTVAAPSKPESRPASGEVPSWLFPSPAMSAPLAAAESRPAADAPRTPVPAVSVAPEPFFPLPQPTQQGRTGSTGDRAGDIGAVVPQRSEGGEKDVNAATDRKPMTSRLPDWLSRPAAAKAPVEPSLAADPAPVAGSPPPAASEPAARDAQPSIAALSELANARTLIVTPPTSAASEPVKPAAPEPRRDEPRKAAETNRAASHSPPVRAAIPPMEPARPAPSEAPVADAAPKPAEKPAITPIADTAPPVARPTVLPTERPRTAKSNGTADLVPTAASSPAVANPTGIRTLEDTVVDLLRPMIRQWLDDNMPRMVEKALRIELAQSVGKTKSDPPKH